MFLHILSGSKRYILCASICCIINCAIRIDKIFKEHDFTVGKPASETPEIKEIACKCEYLQAKIMAKVALIDTMHPAFRFCTPGGKVELENLEITLLPVQSARRRFG